MPRELSECAKVERSILTRFRKVIYGRFLEAVEDYRLVSPGDRIAVCVSGGKDSFLLAKLMQELQRHGDVPFETEFIVMNPGYNEDNARKIEENAALLEIPIKVYRSDIFRISEHMDGEHPCYMCARMRRGFLYSRAQELGCNKIALGHHKSDVIETTLIGMFFGGQVQGMMPKVRSRNFEGMELIRPLYRILEDDIKDWAAYNRLTFINCACSFSERAGTDARVSARADIKQLVKDFRKRNPDVEASIFKSIHNVDLDTLPSFRYLDDSFDFNEKYDRRFEIVRKDDEWKTPETH